MSAPPATTRSATATTTPAPASTAYSTSGQTTSAPTEVFLADLEGVNRSLDMRTGTAQLAGRIYVHSLVYRCADFCNDKEGVIEYSLGKRFRTLTAVVGVDDAVADSTQKAMFEVFVDGQRRASHRVTFGHPKRITVDVAAALRLRLLASIGDVESPLQAGANAAADVPNHLPNVAWADARVLG